MSDILNVIRTAVHDSMGGQIDVTTLGDTFTEWVQGPRHVGCVVSGGIDSSTVTMLARERQHNVPTFTGYYQGERYDERKWARLVAGPNHHEIEITPQDFVDNIDAVIDVVGGREVGPGIFGQYMVAKWIHDHTSIRTVLSGEGGDELFGGYARQAVVAKRQGLDVRVPDGYENLRLPPLYPDTLEGALRWELAGLPGLLEVDALATAPWGITSIAPMTDIRVVATVLSKPIDQRIGKNLLKQAVRGLVPEQVINRTDKVGFAVPFVEWANGPLEGFIKDRIGYTPDIGRPWDRGWWYDLTCGPVAAAA